MDKILDADELRKWIKENSSPAHHENTDSYCSVINEIYLIEKIDEMSIPICKSQEKVVKVSTILDMYNKIKNEKTRAIEEVASKDEFEQKAILEVFSFLDIIIDAIVSYQEVSVIDKNNNE